MHPNPAYCDPAQIVKLALEGSCNAVASTFGVLGAVARRYAHRIPFIVKLNHNELLTFPNRFDQIMFGTVREAREMGAAAVGATIDFGSPESTRQIIEVSTAFAMAHELGLATVLWCYLRNRVFKVGDVDYHLSAYLTGQANHLGVTIQAAIIKQKLPENNGGYRALSMPASSYGKTDDRISGQGRRCNSITPRGQTASALMRGFAIMGARSASSTPPRGIAGGRASDSAHASCTMTR